MKVKESIILLVEDNPDHAELILRSFEEHQGISQIHHVPDGEVALDYLFRRGEYTNPVYSPRPRLILLDLRLPKIDGLEVLREIKHNPELRGIPVVILSTSEADTDLAKASEYFANSYLVKPVDFNRFTRLMHDLDAYWLVGTAAVSLTNQTRSITKNVWQITMASQDPPPHCRR
jgi:CheY-like chemotaxis protein